MSATYRTPGVHIEETAGPPRGLPVAGAVGAIVGEAVRGRTDKAQLISNWTEFVRLYGGFPDLPDAHKTGALSVFLHFDANGGPLLFVRVVGDGAAGAKQENLKDHSDAANSLDVYAQSAGKWGNAISVKTERLETENLAAKIVPGGGGPPACIVDAKSLLNIAVGDVIDFVDEAGAAAGYGVVGSIIPAADAGGYATRNLVSSRSYLLFADTAKINAGAGVDAAAFKLRSCSVHRASARLSEAAPAAATQIKLTSVSGIKVGSLLSVTLVAICNDDTTRDSKIEGHARVTGVSGKTASLAAELKTLSGNAINAAVATDVKAFAKSTWTNGGFTEGFSLVSQLAGTSGNAVSYEVKLEGALAVAVTGNHITITTLANGTTPAQDVAAAITANAAAAKLVVATAIVDAGGNALVNVAVAKRFLTGGAFAQVVSQEFDLAVEEGGVVVERHENLSIVSTSADYVASRLGGAASPPKPNDDNQSQRIVVLRDAVAGDDSLEDFPRSFKSTLLAGGVEGTAPSDVDVLGSSTQGSETGMYVLQGLSPRYVALPGAASAKVAIDGGTFVAGNKAVLLMDLPQSDDSYDAIVNFVQAELAIDDHRVGVYGPWVKIVDPRDRGRILTVPATGGFVTSQLDVAGRRVGHHGAAANKSALRAIIDVAVRFTDDQLGSLNEDLHVNVIRLVQGRGFRLMGDRTQHDGDGRKFMAVRTWLDHYARSLDLLLGPLVFSPINGALMDDVQRIGLAFLDAEWRRGALFPDNDRSRAYSFKCDTETTAQADIAAGTLRAESRVSPATPAEDIVVGIVAESGGITITEEAA